MISINLYEIIFQCINFIVLLWLLKKVLTTPLSNFIKNRAAGIKEDIHTAKSNREESDRILAEQQTLLKKAHTDAQDIRQKAEASAQKEAEMMRKQNEENAEKMLLAAKKDIESSMNKAKSELLSNMSKLCVQLSSKFIQEESSSAHQTKIIESYLEKVKN